MSKLTNVSDNLSVHQRAVSDIKAVIGQSGGSFMNPQLARNAIGLESLDGQELQSVQSSFQEIRQQLLNTPTFGQMLSDVPEHRRNIALEAAALTIMAGGDPQSWHISARAPEKAGAVVVNPNQGHLDYATEYSLEGFEPASLNQWLPQSVYVNTMAVIQGGFEEAFFPIQIVPAGTSGVDVSVSVPKIFAAVTRAQNGAVQTFRKDNIIKALVDTSLLENNSTQIVPVADNDEASPNNLLATDAQVAAVGIVLDGISTDSRPILMGKKVDLIGISTSTALLAGGVLNESDALDSVINVGKVYYTATLDGVSLNVAFDVSRQPGSLLQKTADRSDRLYQTTFAARMVLEIGEISSVNGGNVAAFEAKMDAIGATKVVAEVTLSATAHTEEGYMQVFANDPKWVAAYDADGNTVNFAVGTNTVAPIAYMPQARRTNSNIRLRGTIIDSNVTTNYRFAVPLSSPIISQSPVGGLINTSVEGLAHAERIRNNNNAVKAVLALEEVLAANNGLPVNSPLIGSELVQPAYARLPLDLEGIVVRMASKDSLDDLRGAFTAAIMTVVHKLLQDSEYLAALEFYTGSNNGYEVIIVTDSRIYPWLMETGDSRTLGNNIQYKITQCLAEEMKDKIYISFRRANRDGNLNPMDFGGFLYTPALTHEVQVSRVGGTQKELHHIPRNAHYVTLPVLGRIDVLNMVELFVSE